MVVFCGCDEEFPWKQKARNHEDLEGNMLSAFHDLESKMSIKVHFLLSHFEQISRQPRSCQR